MATSRYSKKTAAVRRVAAGTAVGGAQLRLQLNRDWLVSEHKINIQVAQAYAGVVPASVDVRDFIQTIALETSDGRRVFLTGPQAYDLGRFTEDASNVVSVLGAASSASWAFELHHENDGALLDLLTALRSNEFTTIDAVITFATDALNGFKGGTLPGVATYQVQVESYDREMLTDVQFGSLLGVAKHYAVSIGQATGAAAGQQADVQLITGNRMRFLGLHAYNTTGAVDVLSDAVIGNVRININGRDYRVTDGASIRQDNVAKRGFGQVGVYFVDFGDDEQGFLDLSAVNQARLQWDVLAGAPAGWRVDFCQDYTQM